MPRHPSYRAPLSTVPANGYMWVAGSKQWVDPLAMQMHQIEMVDIALALSNICRYTGHVEHPLTVAEHSVNVMLKYKSQAEKQRGYIPTANDLLAALLHDAAEAYLSDLPKPIKDHPKMAFFSKVEDKLMALIYARFGIRVDDNVTERIKAADKATFMDEWPTKGGTLSHGQARQSFLVWYATLNRDRIHGH
jgi:hypothetical protein